MEQINFLQEKISEHRRNIGYCEDEILSIIKHNRKIILFYSSNLSYKIFLFRKHGNTLEECGRKYGVTRERVRQIESKCNEILRVYGIWGKEDQLLYITTKFQ